MTYIYYTYLNKTIHSQMLQKFSQNFSALYDKKITRYFNWKDAQSSMLGTLLLKNGLQKLGFNYFNLQTATKNNSKPILEIENLHFNISHSGQIVVCALSDCCEIGIDIEIIRNIEIIDFKEQMTDYEWNYIYRAEHPDSAFFEYWTQKEAVLKANGCGIIDSLRSFEIKNKQTQFENSHYFIEELLINTNAMCHLAFKDQLDSFNKAEFIDSSKL